MVGNDHSLALEESPRPRNAFIRLVAVCCSIAFAAMSFAARGADPNKVLHVAFVAPETGFDPQAASDLYSNYVNREIFDPLYKYDYLARPYKVVSTPPRRCRTFPPTA